MQTVTENDPGIRDDLNYCFFCKRKVGELHMYKCVCLTRTVRFLVSLKNPDGSVGSDIGVWECAVPASDSIDEIVEDNSGPYEEEEVNSVLDGHVRNSIQHPDGWECADLSWGHMTVTDGDAWSVLCAKYEEEGDLGDGVITSPVAFGNMIFNMHAYSVPAGNVWYDRLDDAVANQKAAVYA